MPDPTRNPDVERRINEHLEAIDRALAAKGMMLTERRSVTGDVEAQVRDMLAAKAGDAPTAADVEAVLQKLDAPESYAEQEDGAPVATLPLPAEPAVPPRLSRTAIVGAAWAPLLLLVVIGLFGVRMERPLEPRHALEIGGAHGARIVTYEAPRRSWGQLALSLTLLPLGLAALFGTTILGWIAVGQIRRSRGRLCGLGLALADGLLFPLLALDVLIYMFWRVAVAVAISCQTMGFFEALGRPSYSMVDENALLVFVLFAITALVVDWLILRWAWGKLHAAAQP